MLDKNVGPIHYCEPPHAHSPGVASGTVARRLRIDVTEGTAMAPWNGPKDTTSQSCDSFSRNSVAKKVCYYARWLSEWYVGRKVIGEPARGRIRSNMLGDTHWPAEDAKAAGSHIICFSVDCWHTGEIVKAGRATSVAKTRNLSRDLSWCHYVHCLQV